MAEQVPVAVDRRMRERRQHERNGDEAPHYHERHRNGAGSLAKWVTVSFAGGVLATLGFFAIADRARIAGDATQALNLAQSHDGDIKVIREQIAQVRADVAEIKTGQAAVLMAVSKLKP